MSQGVAAKFVCSPPLRPRDHHDDLWTALRDGDLDLIATDHVPDRINVEKFRGDVPFDKIGNGVPGIETLLSLAYSEGVAKGRVSLERMVELVSTRPAELFGLTHKGALEIGKDADIVVFDPTVRRTITQSSLHHACDFTPYEGIAVQGQVRDTVLEAYAGFSPRMAGIARRFFDGRWIDAPVRPGKAPGAFAHPTVPSAHPYVLVNYQGKPRDVMTLAHELGHGVHQVLAAPNGALMAPTPLTLAETASVFGEMLTFRALLARTTNPAERKAMLAAKVEDMLNTVVRQIAFYSFERKLHTERKNGELTADKISELWMSVQAESLGPSIALGPGYETFWAYIGHFVHSPFYVYAYAFGDCLVNSLYGVYERAADGFAERYLAMLAAGGTKHHFELLQPFGLDASDPAFWQIGLTMIEGMIGELEGIEG